MQIKKRIKNEIDSTDYFSERFRAYQGSCGSSGTKANLVDNFADDFETFKKQAAECEKVVFMSSRGGFERHPYHKELVQSYVDELQKLETQVRAQGVS